MHMIVYTMVLTLVPIFDLCLTNHKICLWWKNKERKIKVGYRLYELGCLHRFRSKHELWILDETPVLLLCLLVVKLRRHYLSGYAWLFWQYGKPGLALKTYSKNTVYPLSLNCLVTTLLLDSKAWWIQKKTAYVHIWVLIRSNKPQR